MGTFILKNYNRYVSCASSNINENYLFHAVLHCMYNTEDKQTEIRLRTVNKIISGWLYYKDFIIDLSIVNNSKNYKN